MPLAARPARARRQSQNRRPQYPLRRAGESFAPAAFIFNLRFSAVKTVTIITWAGYIFK